MSNKDIIFHKNCRACGSKKILDLFNLVPTPLGDQYTKIKSQQKSDRTFPLELAICRNCHFVFLNQTVNPNLSYKNYNYKTNTTVGLTDHYDNFVSSIVKRYKLSNKSVVLDIGSNDGSFLSSFRKNNVNIIGIEPAKKIAQYANSKNIKTINNYFNSKSVSELKKIYPKVDIITANYMVANVLDIVDFFNQTKKILKPDGTIIIETGYHPKQFKKNMFDYIYHEHFSYISVTFLTKFLKKFNMYIYSVKETKPKGGSIRIFIKINKYNSKPTINVKKIINYEIKNKINTNIYFQNLFLRIEKQKKLLINLLENIVSKKGKIVGLGASHSTTTLLYHFNIYNYIKYIVDDNPIKHNTYSPGKKIRVYSTSKLYRDNIDYVIILGWQHQNKIVEKHKELLNNNIKFIIPLPTLKIIK